MRCEKRCFRIRNRKCMLTDALHIVSRVLEEMVEWAETVVKITMMQEWSYVSSVNLTDYGTIRYDTIRYDIDLRALKS